LGGLEGRRPSNNLFFLVAWKRCGASMPPERYFSGRRSRPEPRQIV